MDTLPIDEVRSRLFFKTEKYEGWKLTQNRASVIKEGETAMLLLELPPRAFDTGKYTTYMLTATIMQQKGIDTYKDNSTLKIIITKQDFEFLTNVLKVEKEDKLFFSGVTYKNTKGFVVKGRKWFMPKSKDTKTKEIEEQEISLE